jgi:hypothetical protein
VLLKSKCCTQAYTTSLLKYILILIQYLYNYNTIKLACELDPKTPASLRRQEPSSLAFDLIGLVQSLSSLSALESKFPSLSTKTKVSVQQAAWLRHLQLLQHLLKCLLIKQHSRKGPRLGFVQH